VKLYLITAPDGMPAAWCLADPKIGEREVTAALLAHAASTGALRPGLTLIGDKGFAGRDFAPGSQASAPSTVTGRGLRIRVGDHQVTYAVDDLRATASCRCGRTASARRPQPQPMTIVVSSRAV
jgi:hypothetical protein